jgi:DNA-binding winged helix-turn-helix (wHTH) protein
MGKASMPNPVQSSRVVRFEAFELHLKTGELRKGGVKIRLQEQSFQILATLLERPGMLVSRESLHERLWPNDTFVDFDKGLNIAISKLRQALGDSAAEPRFIETLARRGYRFIGAVEALDEPAELLGLPTGLETERTISHYRLVGKLGQARERLPWLVAAFCLVGVVALAVLFFSPNVIETNPSVPAQVCLHSVGSSPGKGAPILPYRPTQLCRLAGWKAHSLRRTGARLVDPRSRARYIPAYRGH